MPIPILLGAAALGTLIVAGGAAGGTYRGSVEAGEGLGDGLRYGVPLAVCATAVYLFLQRK